MSLFSDIAPLIGSVVEAGGNYLAADAQQGAANSANSLAREIYNTQRKDLKPYRQAGKNALSQLRGVYVDGTRDYKASPGYQFRMNEGAKAYDRSASARGMQLSGRAAKELNRYGQNYAAQDYNDNFNRLAAVAGVGQTATNSGNAAAANYGAQSGQAMYNAGDARASGYTGVGSAVNSGINNYLAYDYLNR